MTTDLANSATTGLANGAVVATGRIRDVFGAHEVLTAKVTLTSSAPVGGFSWDPKTFGFEGTVGAVYITPHILVANAAKMRYLYFYDYVNKKIVPADITDAFDDGNGDDLSTVILDILVISE
jgi:hypothetical protein